jgi:Zn/Cd-binding protein ZinT
MRQAIVALIVAVICCFSTSAKVTQQGTMFIQDTVQTTKQPKETKTAYTYKDSKGKTYPVYKGARGSYYIKKVSKKGKEYRQYIPEITKALSKNK